MSNHALCLVCLKYYYHDILLQISFLALQEQYVVQCGLLLSMKTQGAVCYRTEATMRISACRKNIFALLGSVHYAVECIKGYIQIAEFGTIIFCNSYKVQLLLDTNKHWNFQMIIYKNKTLILSFPEGITLQYICQPYTHPLFLHLNI